MLPGVMMTRDEAMSCATFTGGQADRRIGGSSDSRNTERPPISTGCDERIKPPTYPIT